MKDSMVVVLANLKPRNMGPNFASHGMVLAGQTKDGSQVELLTPPAGSQPGDKITFAGEERKPLEQLPAKKSPWESVSKLLTVDGEGNAMWNNKHFTTDKGNVSVATIRNGTIQ